VVQDVGLVKELYAACREFLPLYMIPKFVVISAMPLNASGKADERKLSQFLKDHFHTGLNETTSSAADGPPGSEEDMQNKLVAARFFGNVSAVDNDLRYFSMTSLDIMVFIKDVNTKLGVSVPLKYSSSIPTSDACPGYSQAQLVIRNSPPYARQASFTPHMMLQPRIRRIRQKDTAPPGSKRQPVKRCFTQSNMFRATTHTIVTSSSASMRSQSMYKKLFLLSGSFVPATRPSGLECEKLLCLDQ
jgi:hypothetical protein